MAEYFPLIDRAVAGLPEATAEARRSIYERARTALIGQLRRTEPAVPEEDIARESTALDEAIARVEAKFADHGSAAPKPPPEPATRAAPTALPARSPRPIARPAPGVPGPTADRPPISRPPAAPIGPTLPVGKAPPVAPPPSRERPVLGPAPRVAGEARPQAATPPRPPLANRLGRPTLPIRPAVPGKDASPARPEAAGPDAGEKAPSLPPVTDLTVLPSEAQADPTGRAFADVLDATGDGALDTTGDGAGQPDAGTRLPRRDREAPLRPAAPRPPEPRRFGWPAAVIAAVVAVLMIGVGIAAWRLRDRSDQVAAARPEVQPADASAPGKIAERAAPATPTDTTTDPSGSGAAAPAPVPETDSGPAIAVSQRAALLVDAPEEPQKVKTYTGTVVWHLGSVNPGQGQPLVPAVEADIDLPEAKLKVTMVMQKNQEPQLPASHTIEIHFLPQPGYTLGNVTQINVPDMRKDDDAPTGDPLVGVPASINDNYFLVGLSRGAAEAQNVRLITERNWLDMGVLFAPRRAAKLTFEKGLGGERVWEDALKAWGAPQ